MKTCRFSDGADILLDWSFERNSPNFLAVDLIISVLKFWSGPWEWNQVSGKTERTFPLKSSQLEQVASIFSVGTIVLTGR